MVRKASKILIIDDDKLMLRALSKAISRSLTVSDVVTLSDPLLAESYLSDNQSDYDLIISDFQMPSLSGKEVLTIAKQRAPKALRIIMSGDTNENLISKDDVPANYFMQKPFDKQDLALLETFLSRLEAIEYTDEQKMLFGLLPYFPFPSRDTKESLDNIVSLSDIYDTQLQIHIEKAHGLFKTENPTPKLEFSVSMLRCVSTAYYMSLELIHTIGVGQQTSACAEYLLWSSQAYSVAQEIGIPIKQCEEIYQVVFIGYLEYLIQQYFNQKLNAEQEGKTSLYLKYLLAWGIEKEVLENRLRVLSPDSSETSQDLILRLFIGLSPDRASIEVSELSSKKNDPLLFGKVIEQLRQRKLVLEDAL
ncbi:hypothetical protein A7985_24065 [Pseudoalteromonas luteoviolacea]|uniref:Response regulatory domain-containing protein n=1 Tax=Pseudoalteromonas luteoviolacea TaxID=43657 RepID=A0A1C0TJI8_9GAMM|nr:response regulator [Pseudoalteromonas luteoviolacea]OCQ18289.1 hypothetical protein A7985_24065 [Pseudoalteromonas luteoviolacea]